MGLARLVALALVICAACGGKKPPTPSDQLWAKGDQAMQDEAWDVAVQNYKSLLGQYPFDPKAEDAEIKIAEAYYNAKRYPEAIAAFGDFERMHPTSDHLAQIEYRRGMSYLAQHRSSDRDQQSMKNAADAFKNVVDRHPGTPWASKAELRLRECRQELADHDADIAVFYLKRGSLRAAEARLRGLLTDFPDTDATAQTLWDFAGAYSSRDEPEEANLALATLARHHPETPVGRSAREKLGTLDPAAGQDPLPLLVSRIDELRTEARREQVPRPVSAYSDRPGMPGGRAY